MKTRLASTVAALALIAGLGLAPVLSSAPAYAVDNMTSTDAPDLTSVRTKIKAKDYAGALAELRELADDVQHADVYNLMGYTLRKTGDFKTSLTYYTKAIEMQPEHKAAREYLGELYVETGNMVSGEGWISAGPGYRRTVLGGQGRLDMSAAISWNYYTMAQVAFDLPHLAHDHLSIGVQTRYQDSLAIDYFGVGNESCDPR